MRRYGAHIIGVLLILWMTIFSQLASAEVYKWVDAEGNIHFGDKPLDPALADQAESVDIVESYQPDPLTAEDREAFAREQQAISRKTELYRQEEEEERKLEQEERREKQIARCEALHERITKLSTMQTGDGVLTYYYATGEDGKSVTSAEQREIVGKLKEEYAAAGCS